MIGPFVGSYRWLSNFWLSPITMPDGITYPTVEHAYQAQKSEFLPVRRAFARCPSPRIAKQMGRGTMLRPNWDKMKVEIMAQALTLKFQNPVLRQQLINTGDEELVELNTWGDTFWGVCKGVGENHLGKLLMAERTRCQAVIKEKRNGR